MENGKWTMEKILFYLLILFLPTQLGKHFWPDFSIVNGIRVDYLSPTLYFTDVLVALLFVAFLAGKVRHSGKRVTSASRISNGEPQRDPGPDEGGRLLDRGGRARMTVVVLYLITISFFIFNILLSHNIFNGYYHLLKFLEFSFVAYFAASFLRTRERFQTLVTVFSVGVIGESVLAFFQYAQQGSLGGLLYYFGERTFTGQTPGIANAAINGQLIMRPYATFSHPNVLAGYLVIALTLIVFSFSSQTAIWKKILFFLSFTVGTLALLLTFSRVAIVLWTIFFLMSFAARLKKQEYQAFFLSAMTVVVFLGSIFLTPLFYRFAQTTASEEAFIHRETLLAAAAQMISDNPFLGVGFGNFLPTLATVQNAFSASTYFQPVHNIYLLVAAELGIIGFAFFMFFLFRTYVRIRKHTYAGVCGFLFTAVLILGFFDHYFLTLQQGQLLFALVVGLCWAKIKN